MKKGLSYLVNTAAAAVLAAGFSGPAPAQAGGFNLGDLADDLGRGAQRALEDNLGDMINDGIDGAFGNDPESRRAQRNWERQQRRQSQDVMRPSGSFNNCSLLSMGRKDDSILKCGNRAWELKENYGSGRVGSCTFFINSRGKPELAQCDYGTFKM